MKHGAPLNPFSASFHRPGALPYRFRESQSAETLWRRFTATGRRGEIVGLHGTGKTTLLRSLEPIARETGEEIRVVTLHDGERWPKELLGPRASCPPDVAPTSSSACPDAGVAGMAARAGPRASLPACGQDGRAPRTLFLDGAEQLASVAWLALRLWVRATGLGLLVTTHRPLGLPTLHTTAVDDEAALWVTRAVLAQNPHAPLLVDAGSVTGALAECKGNLREALFHLYDIYEDRWKIHASEVTANVTGPRMPSGCARGG